MTTKQQAAEASERYLETGNFQYAKIVADDWPVCTNCVLDGVCANAQKLEEWLLQEVSS